MDAIQSFRTSLTIYQIPWHHTPEYSHLHTHLPKNAKSSTCYTRKDILQACANPKPYILLSFPSSQHSESWHTFPRLLLILSCQKSVLKTLFLVLLASCPYCCCRRQRWPSRSRQWLCSMIKIQHSTTSVLLFYSIAGGVLLFQYAELSQFILFQYKLVYSVVLCIST